MSNGQRPWTSQIALKTAFSLWAWDNAAAASPGISPVAQKQHGCYGPWYRTVALENLYYFAGGVRLRFCPEPFVSPAEAFPSEGLTGGAQAENTDARHKSAARHRNQVTRCIQWSISQNFPLRPLPPPPLSLLLHESLSSILVRVSVVCVYRSYCSDSSSPPSVRYVSASAF